MVYYLFSHSFNLNVTLFTIELQHNIFLSCIELDHAITYYEGIDNVVRVVCAKIHHANPVVNIAMNNNFKHCHVYITRFSQ